MLKIGQLDVLARLYGNVVIPPQVAAELASPRRPDVIRQAMVHPPAWLRVQTPGRIAGMDDLDAGERAAIALAEELAADLLLIDETAGRRAAHERHIPTARLAAVLYDAAVAGVLPDFADVFARLRATNFRVPEEALDALLRKFQSRGTTGDGGPTST
jgi:predicted nucleic acid-binding protein